MRKAIDSKRNVQRNKKKIHWKIIKRYGKSSLVVGFIEHKCGWQTAFEQKFPVPGVAGPIQSDPFAFVGSWIRPRF